MSTKRSASRKLSTSVMAMFILISGSVIGLGSLSAGSDTDGSLHDANAMTQPEVKPASPFALLALWTGADERDSRKLLQPVDPVTLEPLAGYEPIEFITSDTGGYLEQAVSPDGTMLIVVAHPPGDGESGSHVVLNLVDLVGWTNTTITDWPVATGYTNAAQPKFDENGQSFYWTMHASGNSQWSVMRYDIASASQSLVSVLPRDFLALDYRVAADDLKLFAFGTTVHQDLDIPGGNSVLGDFSASEAQVLIIDLDGKEEPRTVVLDGVAAGAVPVQDATRDNFPVDLYTPGLAWSADGTRLYVAGAYSPTAVVVDLDTGTVQNQFTFDQGASWIDRLAGWLVQTASAAARGILYGFIVELEDQHALAVANTYELLTPNRQELLEAAQYHVWLVDTRTGEQRWQSSVGGVVGLARSSDGRNLVVHSTSEIYFIDDHPENDSHFLRLLDIQTGHRVAELELPGRPLRGRDSMIVTDDYVYVQVSTESGPKVIVASATDLSIVGNWEPGEEGANIYRLFPLP